VLIRALFVFSFCNYFIFIIISLAPIPPQKLVGLFYIAELSENIRIITYNPVSVSFLQLYKPIIFRLPQQDAQWGLAKKRPSKI
jgi:hypothetical protein